MTGSDLSEEDAEGEMYASGVSTTIYNLEGTPHSALGDWYHSFIQSPFANDFFYKIVSVLLLVIQPLIQLSEPQIFIIAHYLIQISIF